MAIILKVADKFPKTCDKCPLFVNEIFGQTPFCVAGGKYTMKEIKAEEDGRLNVYYHGCLSHRPKNCPLEQI